MSHSEDGNELTERTTSSSNGHDRQNSDDKAIQTQQFECEPAGSRRQNGGFVSITKRHCAKWWWVHIIVFCVLFLIIALCLVYAAMPHIAQTGINDSSLEVTDLEFLSPTSDSVYLSQKAIIHSPSMYTPTLDPFISACYLVTNGTFGAVPMINIPIPRIHALHPQSSIEVVNAYAPFNTSATLQQVTDFATAALSDEWVTTAIVGETKLHEGALPVITVKYNKTATYKGLNGLKGFNVSEARINLTAVNEPNLNALALIPNPSPLTIALGNVTLMLTTAQAGLIGNSTILNLTLRPGLNSYPMSAFLNETQVVSSIDPTIGAGMVELLITTNASIYNGNHLTYYEKALASTQLKLTMNVTQVLLDSVSG